MCHGDSQHCSCDFGSCCSGDFGEYVAWLCIILIGAYDLLKHIPRDQADKTVVWCVRRAGWQVGIIELFKMFQCGLWDDMQSLCESSVVQIKLTGTKSPLDFWLVNDEIEIN